jgi:hypothetical protein
MEKAKKAVVAGTFLFFVKQLFTSRTQVASRRLVSANIDGFGGFIRELGVYLNLIPERKAR